MDHASNYVHVEFQTHLTSHETLKAKEQYELMCRDHGVVPQSYLSDNGPAFASKAFSLKLIEFAQIIRFAGAGAHHQNGNAERAIGTIMSISRTMMLHAAIHWPDVADTTLWPMAVAHAVYLYNHVPDPSTGIAPVDVFTRSRWEQRKLHDLHVWGCPVYVLNKSLADGKKLPRWKPRSQRSINMGLSAKHASTVPLVLHPDTGSITPQFHVVFDDWFATIAASTESLPDFESDEWARLFGDSTYQYPFDDDDIRTLDDVASDPPPTLVDWRRDSVARAMDNATPPIPLAVAQPPTVPSVQQPSAPPPTPLIPPARHADPSPSPAPTTPLSAPREPVSQAREPISQPREPASRPPRELRVSDLNQQRENQPRAAPAPAPTPPRRSQRQRTAPTRLGFDGTQGSYGYLTTPMAFLFPIVAHVPTPYTLKAAATDPDTFTYREAMSSEFADDWREAMAKEISALEGKNTWTETDKSNAESRILPGTWVFRIKRTPDGIPYKFKARYCVRGDLQEGDPETFAPVVAWSSVRLFLVLSLLLDWYTCTVDFSNAFVQAKLDSPIWIHLPQGFRSSRGHNTCLRLQKSLYGVSVAPRLWYEHLTAALVDEGFKSSQNDPCLLHKTNMMVVQYVDDLAVAAKDETLVNELIARLQGRGFELTREGSFSEFLGIKFDQDPVTKSINMTQKGLIQKIIETTGMTDCKPNWTPAATEALGIDPDGEPMTEEWSYPSIVGMLLYLTTNTRPDLAFAVSQVARFTHSPKQSHASAVKTIVRYLHRTSDQGMIFSPTGNFELEMYVDADFGGLYRRDPDSEPTSAKSRTGFLINLGGCPLLWKSHLQSSISLSTTESEYSALSSSLRTLLPLQALLLEVIIALELSAELRATVISTVFEDNAACLLLATTHRTTNRTKYYHIKWHWFWDSVRRGLVSIKAISTKDQRADYLTKGLVRETFERIRKLVQGW